MAYSYIEYNADGSTTTFSVPFDYTAQADIKVFVDGVEDTSFTFNSASVIQTSTIPTASAVVRVERNTDLDARAVDFASGSVLTEEDLDNSNIQVFFAAQEAIDTAESALIQTPDGKWDAQSRVIKNVTNPTNAQDAVTKNYLENTWLTLSDKAQLNALNLTNLNRVHTSIDNLDDVAGSISNVDTLAPYATDIDTISPFTTQINNVSTNMSDVNRVHTSIANVDRVATSADNLDRVHTSISAVDTVAADLNEPVSEIETVATSITNVNNVGSNIQNVIDVDANESNINAAVANESNINAAVSNATNITNVANNATNITNVAGNQANINQVATDTVAVTNVSSNIGAVSNVSTNMSAVTNVNTNMSVVTNVSNNMADIQAVEAEVAKVVAVANDLAEATSEIDVVAGSIANVDLVGGSIANVNEVAANLADVNNFADTYSIGATAPSLPTTGDLWFDSSASTMKVYDGTGFVNAGSSVSGVASSVEYTATAGQTSFAASYDAGAVDVYLNGVLLAVSDYTATDGANIVLGTGASVGDTVYIQAFGTFALASHYTKTETDNLLANIDALPDQTGHSGQFLTTDGTTADWASVDALPDQTGHSGQFLTTDGTTADWADTGAKGGVFWENDAVVSADYTISANKNAGTFGPITINSGVTVQVPTGSRWVVV